MRRSYRIYRADATGGSNQLSHQNDFMPMDAIKKEEESLDDDYNIGDYLETNVDCSTSESFDTGNGDMYMTPTSPPSTKSFNDPFQMQLTNKQVLHSMLSQKEWITSPRRKSTIHLHDNASSSPPLSQRSETITKPLSYAAESSNNNRYRSFGMYIAETLSQLDERHANELHISILQEIIKVQTKVANAQ